MPTLKIGLLGFGTVGSSFAEVLAASGADARITHVFNRGVARKKTHAKAKFVGADAVWTERVEDVLEVVAAVVAANPRHLSPGLVDRAEGLALAAGAPLGL